MAATEASINGMQQPERRRGVLEAHQKLAHIPTPSTINKLCCAEIIWGQLLAWLVVRLSEIS